MQTLEPGEPLRFYVGLTLEQQHLDRIGKGLQKDQEVIKAITDKMIADYKNLPFYRKWFTPSPIEQIRAIWREFDAYQTSQFNKLQANLAVCN